MTLKALLKRFLGDDAERVLKTALARELRWGGGRPASDVFIAHRNLLYRGPDVRKPRLGWSAAYGWRPCYGPSHRAASWGFEVDFDEALDIMQSEIDYGRYAH